MLFAFLSWIRFVSSSSSNIIGHEPFRKRLWPSSRNTAHIWTKNTSGIKCARSYRTLRDGFFLGTLFQALRARLRSVRPCGTWLAAFSQQTLSRNWRHNILNVNELYESRFYRFARFVANASSLHKSQNRRRL